MAFQFRMVTAADEIERYNRWEIEAAGVRGTPPPTAM